MAAVAPVMHAERKDIASASRLTAVVGMVMVVLLPAAVPLLGLSHYQHGIVAGMAVYVVSEPFDDTIAVLELMVTGPVDHTVFAPRSVS